MVLSSKGEIKAMLHKSFKPAKCKTALQLALSRMKLLKNKKDSQIKHLKRELAQLLESGQDQTARIRVEHVVREEKTLAAYELVEVYCELIVARLPIIESQKNCPIDLKEAISSIIFASPRCADIPELMDVRKHFTAKYGKDFVSAAVELRPDCGVSRLLVEKLSAKAPDGPTKLKILSAIAEEHNVKWDPKSFGEKEMRPPEDLLNGPNTFEQASKINIQEPPNSIDMGPPNVGVRLNHNESHAAPVNSYDSSSISSPHSQAFPSTAIDANKAVPSGISHSDLRPLGIGSEAMEFRHLYASEQSHSSAGRQGWNMEFKDATAAAQAAAESAELASMAARAAAELSSQGRISRQHSTESNKASPFRSKDEGLQNYASSRLQGENLGQVPAHRTFHSSNFGVQHEQSFEDEQDDLAQLAERFYNLKNSNKTTRLASSKPTSSCMDDLQMEYRHSRKTSYELEKSDHLGEVNVKRESSESEGEFASEVHTGLRSENVGFFEEASTRRQSSSVSSSARSRIPSDGLNVISSFRLQRFNEEAVNEPFNFDERQSQRDTNDINSYDNPGVVFDDSGSDDDELNFGVEEKYNGQDSSSSYFSEGTKPSSHILADRSAKSPWLIMQESLGKSSSQSPFVSDSHPTGVFSEGSINDRVPSQVENFLPVTFDDSDGPGSESEGELNESKLVRSKHSGNSPREDIAHSSNPDKTQNVNAHLIESSLAEKVNMGLNRKSWMQASSAGSDVEVHPKRTKGTEVGAETESNRKFGYGYLHDNQNSCVLLKSQSNSDNIDGSLSSVKEDVQNYQSPVTLEDSEPIKDSSLGSGKALNFGILSGGLRNKGYRHPPYRRDVTNSSSASKQVEEENSRRIKQPSSSIKVDFGSGALDQELVHEKTNEISISGIPVDANDYDSDEEFLHQTIPNNQKANVRKVGSGGNQKPVLRSYFDMDKSDSEEDLPKEIVASKTRSGPGISRRTKTPLSSSERDSSFQVRVHSKSLETADNVVEQKSSTASLYAAETQVKPRSQTRNSYYQGSFEQGKSPDEANSKPVSQHKRSVHEESTSKSSYSIDTQKNHPSKASSSDHWGRSEQHKSAEPSKPIPESKRSSREEKVKSLAKEQPSNPSPRTVALGGAESATKTSRSRADPPSRENSINKASHVHPKLPDYDTIAAHLLFLRQNRE